MTHYILVQKKLWIFILMTDNWNLLFSFIRLNNKLWQMHKISFFLWLRKEPAQNQYTTVSLSREFLGCFKNSAVACHMICIKWYSTCSVKGTVTSLFYSVAEIKDTSSNLMLCHRQPVVSLFVSQLQHHTSSICTEIHPKTRLFLHEGSAFTKH